MMIRFFLVCILLIYYWYFYTSPSRQVPRPATGSPSKPTPYDFRMTSKQPNHFRFVVRGQSVWEHTLPVDTFTFHPDQKIVAIDPCHGTRDGAVVPAVGRALYERLQNDPPSFARSNAFRNVSPDTVRSGTAFYFQCFGGRVEKLDMCPSGTTLVEGVCEPVNACTLQPDGALFSHAEAFRFVRCLNGKETVHACPEGTIFYHNRCEDVARLHHYCKAFPDVPFLLNETTRVECVDEKMVFVRCAPGTRFFENDYCEPDACSKRADGTRLPLPETRSGPFSFVPGYSTCQSEKVHETVQCPQEWDESLTRGDDLTFLPMVFDGERCSVPTFCENVFSDDPDVVVPVHEFTKSVKNWTLSAFLDRSAGFECENGKVRKRKLLHPGTIVSKRFKVESACDEVGSPLLLPIYGDSKSFYDCTAQRSVPCPDEHFFDGSACARKPISSDSFFSYKDLPLFRFDSLNSESWIKAWDYSLDPAPACRDPQSAYVELYNVCSHPDCSNFAFLSQIPDLALLLPREHRAKCRFDEKDGQLKKEPVDFDYSFWNQKKAVAEEDPLEENCVPGQALQTGHFIWDSTVYATCNLSQPFVFCPSRHSLGILSVPTTPYFACRPPIVPKFAFWPPNPTEFTPFETNEIKRILPFYNRTHVRLNTSKTNQMLPDTGLDIPKGSTLNLWVQNNVIIEPRYRVTHPPNVIFDYNKEDEWMFLFVRSLEYGFVSKDDKFTNKPLKFPRYKAIPLVESFHASLNN